MPIKAGLLVLFTYRTLLHSLADEPDYWPPSLGSNPSSAGSSTNIGAIIGGVIGGAAGLLLILIGGYLLYKGRQRRSLQKNETSITHTGGPATNTHAHRPSDPFTFSQTLTNSSLPTSYMTSSPHGIGSVPSTLAPPLYSSFHVSTPPPPKTAPIPTAGHTAAQRMRPIPRIEICVCHPISCIPKCYRYM